MRTIILIGFAFFTGYFTSFAQDDEKMKKVGSDPARTISVEIVTDSIYMFKGRGGNIGIFKGDDGVLMIDDQFAEVTPEILNLLKSLSDKPVQFLVNTHHHGDHTGGNENMKNAGATIFAHDNVRRRLLAAEMQKEKEKINTIYQKKIEKLTEEGKNENVEEEAKKSINAAMEQFEVDDKSFPVITFSEDITFHFNGEKIMVFHVHNAHTDGDVLVYFTSNNVLHTGDVFFNGKYPYIDTKSGGNYDGYVKALERVLMLVDDETRIIPGHGEVGTKADLKFSHDMMVALKNRVTYHYLDGKSLEEILAMKEVSGEYDAKGFGDGFISTEKFVGLIYNMAKAKYVNRPEKK